MRARRYSACRSRHEIGRNAEFLELHFLKPFNDILQLGVSAPFNDGGFGEIVPDSEFVLSKIAHKAKIEVTEEGTEASAATTAFLVTKSAILIEHVDFDKPFLFVVRDNVQKLPLFIGKVTNP